MIRKSPRGDLQTRYESPASSIRAPKARPIPPVWSAPLHRPAHPIQTAPANLGMGRPAQSAAGQP